MKKELPNHYRIAINHYLMGKSKAESVAKAGMSKNAAADVFNRPEVREEIERRIKLSEKKVDMDRAYLLDKLRTIIDAEPGEVLEVDEKGRLNTNYNNLSPTLKKAISKFKVEESREGGKYKRTKRTVQFDVPDKIAAIKEAATLLGIREEKSKVDIEYSLIEELSRRRKELAGEE